MTPIPISVASETPPSEGQPVFPSPKTIMYYDGSFYPGMMDSPPVSPTSSEAGSECSTGSTSSSSFVNRKPKYPTKYHEMLQPLAPSVTSEPTWRPELECRGQTDSGLQAELFALLRGSSVVDLEAFLAANAQNLNINGFDLEVGQTALHEACQLGRLDMARCLVRHGASVELANRDGFSAIHLAAWTGNAKLISFLANLK